MCTIHFVALRDTSMINGDVSRRCFVDVAEGDGEDSQVSSEPNGLHPYFAFPQILVRRSRKFSISRYGKKLRLKLEFTDRPLKTYLRSARLPCFLVLASREKFLRSSRIPSGNTLPREFYGILKSTEETCSSPLEIFHFSLRYINVKLGRSFKIPFSDIGIGGSLFTSFLLWELLFACEEK